MPKKTPAQPCENTHPKSPKHYGTRSKGPTIPEEIHQHVRDVLGELNLGQDQLGRIAFRLAKSVASQNIPSSECRKRGRSQKDIENAHSEPRKLGARRSKTSLMQTAQGLEQGHSAPSPN